MQPINRLLREKRKEKGLTMKDVANAVGVSEATVSRWESGEIADMGRSKIYSLSKILGLSPSEIMGITDDELKFSSPNVTTETITYPVIGNIAAGYDHTAIEDWRGETVEIPVSYLKGRKRDEFFVLKVIGDSMYPLYQEGDKVLILKQSTLNYSGQIGAILYDDCATIKKVEFVNGENWLKMIPINPMYPPRVIEGIDLEQCRVLGIPKLLIREI